MAQATSDRAVTVIEATCAHEQLPRITEDPEDCAAKHAAIESTVGSVDGIMVMGKHETGFARVARDHYPTREVWVTEALLDHVDVAGLKIWEMAAGAGDMAEVLKAAGAWVFCSDIADYGYPLNAMFDFTSADMPPLLDFDAMITNPPGGLCNHLAVKFI